MASLDLESPPDLDDSRIPEHLWSRMRAVLGAVEEHFGVVLNCPPAREIASFADIAAAVQDALWERQPPATGL